MCLSTSHTRCHKPFFLAPLAIAVLQATAWANPEPVIPVAPEIPGIDITFPEAPDFDNASGFTSMEQPLGGSWNDQSTALNFSQLSSEIGKAEQGLRLVYNRPSGWSPTANMVAISGSGNSIDAQGKNLRFLQSTGQGRATVFRLEKGTSLTLSNIGNFELSAEDNYQLISASSRANLNVQADNIWLQNSVTNVASNKYLIFGNTSSTLTFHATNDFVALMDVSRLDDLSSTSYSLIETRSLDLHANNIYIGQIVGKASPQHSSAIYMYSGDNYSITADNTLYIAGVQTGIRAEANEGNGLTLKATNVFMNISSLNDGSQGSSHANVGIYSQAKLNLSAETVQIQGAAKAFDIWADDQVQIIEATNIYLDAGEARDFDDTLSDKIRFKSSSAGIRTYNSDCVDIDAKESIVIKDFARGILITYYGAADIASDNIFITHDEARGRGDIGVGVFTSFTDLKSDVLAISNYDVGLGAYATEPDTSESQRSVFNLNNIGHLSLSAVGTAIESENSNLTINAETAYIRPDAKGKAVSARNQAAVSISTSGQALVYGDLEAVDSKLDMKLGVDSVFEGKTVNSGDGSLNMTLGDGSAWYVVAGSNATTLTGAGANLIFDEQGTAESPSIHIDGVKGSGVTFVLAANDGLLQTSFLDLGTDSTEGSHTVEVTLPSPPAEGEDIKVQFATDASGKLAFEAGNSISDAGLWITTPELESRANKTGGKDWFITNITADPAPTPISMIDGLQSNYFFWRSMYDSTRERFGELRKGVDAGLWGRITAGSLSYGSIDTTYQTYRLGLDAAITENIRTGFMIERYEGNLKGNGGKGDMGATTVALYGLYISPEGYYADAGVRFGLMDYDYANNSLLPDAYDYQTSAVSGWLEVGKDFSLSKNFFVNPHVAFAYGRLSSEDFTTRNGLSATTDAVDSAIFTLGTDFGLRNETLEVAFTADFMHEALGDQTITVQGLESSLTEEISYSDSWAEYGLSFAYRPEDTLNVWLNLRRSAFSEVDRDWRINAGLRWSY